jgi:SAM-dependent methyltransferase
MRYRQFDYFPILTEAEEPQTAWWINHWDGREAPTPDLSHEWLWPTISPELARPGLLLEAGCGPAQWVQFLQRLGHTAIGVDYAVQALRTSKRANGHLHLVGADLRRLPFPDNCFDYICSFGAVEHDSAGPEEALEEFRRVLQPDGILMCSVPCLNVERTMLLPGHALRDCIKTFHWVRRLARKPPFEFYQYLFSPKTYRAVLKRCGFEVESLRTYGTSSEGQALRALARVLASRIPFYNGHMMMAVCHKRANRVTL